MAWSRSEASSSGTPYVRDVASAERTPAGGWTAPRPADDAVSGRERGGRIGERVLDHLMHGLQSLRYEPTGTRVRA